MRNTSLTLRKPINNASPVCNGFADIGQRNVFFFRFVNPEYEAKMAVKPPWSDCVFRKLVPKTKAEAIALSFYPFMVRPSPPEDPHPSSQRWCRDPEFFAENYKFAKNSAEVNFKELGFSFDYGPAAPRPDGSCEANENCSKILDYDEYLEHMKTVKAATTTQEVEAESPPTSPKPKRRSKASKPIE